MTAPKRDAAASELLRLAAVANEIEAKAKRLLLKAATARRRAAKKR